MQYFISAGSKLDVCEKLNHQTPLYTAALHNYTEAAQMLISAGIVKEGGGWLVLR